MPRYDYDCPAHGRFERVAGYDDSVVVHDCGKASQRVSVYATGVIFSGGGFTKSVLPPPGPESQHEYHKEVRKRGWDGDRAVSELRKHTFTDEQGRKHINTAAMPKEA